VFTSNCLADELCDEVAVGAPPHEVDEVSRRRLHISGMRPELLSRMRSFLLFRQLDNEALARVAVLTIRRTLETFGLELVAVDADVVSSLLRDIDARAIGTRGLEYRASAMLSEAVIGVAERDPEARVALRWEHDEVIAESVHADDGTEAA